MVNSPVLDDMWNFNVFGDRFKRTGKRNDIFLATKFGITPTGVDGTAENVKASAEKALKRLGVETIDLFYLHRSETFTLLRGHYQLIL